MTSEPTPSEEHRGPDGPDAVAGHYRSVDSAPAVYARRQPASRTNGFLVVFAGVSVLIQAGFTMLAARGWTPNDRDLVFVSEGGQETLLPARLFLISFFAVFACWIDTNLWRRLLVGVELVGGFVLVSFLIDLIVVQLGSLVAFQAEVIGQQLLSAMIALALFPVVVMSRNAVLPPALPLTRRRRRIPWYLWLRLIVPLGVALVVALWAERQWFDEILWLRSWALLGGVGPGLFLVQQLFVVQTVLIGLWIIRRSRRRNSTYYPDVGVIVPAHNEAHDIAAAITAIATTSREYPGRLRLYVVDNASTDDTVGVARAAVAAADGLEGEVLECPTPGKALALNHGIARMAEEVVVRIDADTVLDPRCLERAVRHLADPTVGAVGGRPVSRGSHSFFDRVRRIEVLMRHGFYQLGLLGFGGVIGVPGMFVAYRRTALTEVGELVQGMNGEDTDICLRIGAAGYRIMVDPAATYHTETPQNWRHMREQRTRWFRSLYHVVAHNRHLVFETRSMASAVTVPFQLVSAARRAMFAPLLIAAPLALLFFPGTFPSLAWPPIIATFVGLPFLVALFVCLVWRDWRAILYLPEYLVFRVIRSWFTIGALLSLVFPPLHPTARLRRRSASRTPL